MDLPAPTPELHPHFSEAGSQARPWHEVARVLQANHMFWLATVRRDSRPHVVPLPAIWLENSLYFCTGSAEQKAVNLAHSSACVLSTGTPEMNSGLDVAVEGTAERITDSELLHRLAQRWLTELDWPYDVVPGGFAHPPATPEAGADPVLVFGVRPSKVLAFGKGAPFTQTRFRLG